LKAQHDTLVGALQAAITEASHGAGNEVVTLIGGEGEIERHGSIQKCL
jgi:hypothetical protein